MNANRPSTKWFFIGFGIRAWLAVVLTLVQLIDWESVYWYFADPATMLYLALVENFFTDSVSHTLTGNHPFYIPMNLVASFMWGGIFMLIPRVRKIVARLRSTRYHKLERERT